MITLAAKYVIASTPSHVASWFIQGSKASKALAAAVKPS
jgi:hypothetical protein